MIFRNLNIHTINFIIEFRRKLEIFWLSESTRIALAVVAAIFPNFQIFKCFVFSFGFHSASSMLLLYLSFWPFSTVCCRHTPLILPPHHYVIHYVCHRLSCSAFCAFDLKSGNFRFVLFYVKQLSTHHSLILLLSRHYFCSLLLRFMQIITRP